MKKCQKISCAKIALQDIFTLMSWFSSASRSSNRRMTQARAVNLVGAKPCRHFDRSRKAEWRNL